MKDPRFKYFYQANKGVSEARNLGLSVSKGEFVFFVDSDDYLELDTLEKLVSSIAEYNSDIVVCDVNIETEAGISLSTFSLSRSGVISKDEALKKLATDIQLPSWMCNKCYKRELFSNVSFPSGLRVLEDFKIQCELFKKAKIISCVSGKAYHYVQRLNSAIHTPSVSDELQMLFVRLERVYFYVNNYPNFAHLAYHSLLVNSYYSVRKIWKDVNSRNSFKTRDFDRFLCECIRLYKAIPNVTFLDKVLWKFLFAKNYLIICLILSVILQLKMLYRFCNQYKNKVLMQNTENSSQ